MIFIKVPLRILKQQCIEDHRQYCLRDLRNTLYIYFLADYTYTVILDNMTACSCWLIIGVTTHRCKDLVAGENDYQ